MTRICSPMSGFGKSTLIDALAQLGHRVVDLDDPQWSEYRVLGADELPPGIEPGPDWVWRDEQVAALLRSIHHWTGYRGGCGSAERTRFAPTLQPVQVEPAG